MDLASGGRSVCRDRMSMAWVFGREAKKDGEGEGINFMKLNPMATITTTTTTITIATPKKISTMKNMPKNYKPHFGVRRAEAARSDLRGEIAKWKNTLEFGGRTGEV
jgi:hypothetical protein